MELAQSQMKTNWIHRSLLKIKRFSEAQVDESMKRRHPVKSFFYLIIFVVGFSFRNTWTLFKSYPKMMDLAEKVQEVIV